ncbi:MAG: hypothetical protein ACI9MC_002669 [Kiritimatiellia bacterium]
MLNVQLREVFMRLTLFTAPLVLLFACGGSNDFDGYNTLAGELNYTNHTSDGAVVCDVDLALTGTTFTGPCSDCTFAFHVEPTIIEDRGSEDCELRSLWTYVDDDFIDQSGLGYADATVDIDGKPMDDALVAVGVFEGRMTSAGVVADGQARSEVSWDGEGNLSWSHQMVEAHGPDLLYHERECVVTEVPELGGRKTEGAYQGTGELTCAGFEVDVWTFNARAGERVDLALDTVAADSAFDSVLFVEDPDGCLVALGDDVFRCSYAPLDYSCGGGRFTPEKTGTYRIIAGSYDACTAPDLDGDGYGDVAEYRLSIDASYDPELALEQDEVPRFEDQLTTTIDGQALVTRGGQ